ncbi:hypothetical protein DPMN_171448 [Dreissena polymorpha]|uniref:Uncharacterized protein n=1 Tax=Dreissena polymorpha TaxID=45954 RepID=A0A9D4IDR2_DREPO|nr:hypothetical protein DPMN_171448 [Dreissena polymorpha]
MDNGDADRTRLTQYRQYDNLSDSDTDVLIVLWLALSPDVLINKCIFQNEAMCKDTANQFFEIEAVRNNLLVAGNIMTITQSVKDHDI